MIESSFHFVIFALLWWDIICTNINSACMWLFQRNELMWYDKYLWLSLSMWTELLENYNGSIVRQSETFLMRCPRIGVWVSPVPCGFRRSAPSHTVHTEPVNKHFMLQKGQKSCIDWKLLSARMLITLSTIVELLYQIIMLIYQHTLLALLQVVQVIHNPNEDILHDWILISFCDICIIVMRHNLH